MSLCCLASPSLELQQKHSAKGSRKGLCFCFSYGLAGYRQWRIFALSECLDALKTMQVGVVQAGNMLRGCFDFEVACASSHGRRERLRSRRTTDATEALAI